MSNGDKARAAIGKYENRCQGGEAEGSWQDPSVAGQVQQKFCTPEL